VSAQFPDSDQALVTSEAGHADHGFDAVVDRRQPPRACATHAHSLGSDPLGIDLRARGEIVERDLLVAKHHAPQRPAQPQVQLEQGHLLVGAHGHHLAVSRRSGALAFPVEVVVDGHDDVAVPRQQFGDSLRRRLGAENVLLAAAVPVHGQDCGETAGPVGGNGEIAGHLRVDSIREHERLDYVPALILRGERAHIRVGRAWRQVAEALDDDRSHTLTLALPLAQARRHRERASGQLAESLGNASPRFLQRWRLSRQAEAGEHQYGNRLHVGSPLFSRHDESPGHHQFYAREILD